MNALLYSHAYWTTPIVENFFGICETAYRAPPEGCLDLCGAHQWVDAS